MPRLPPEPDLEWTAYGAPRSRAFDDAYFSRDGGLAEAEAVFLAGCGLPDAWAGRDRFALCELGFGTGLNALAVWKAWQRTRMPHAILHMCTVEAFPLGATDAARALAASPDVAPWAERLLARWPVRAAAPQRLWFPEDGFALTVLVSEASEALACLSGRFDAWFLDGFAPARNEAMWEEALFHRIAELSAPGARVASYSVAGPVRRGLEAAGFAVEKRPGFGSKRERLEAALKPTLSLAERVASGSEPGERRANDQAPASRHAPRPLTASPQGRGGFPLYPSAPSHPKRVAIIGAGIAGAACAFALARRNVETIVLDAAPMLGAGASGNPAGIVAPRLDRGATPAAEVFLAAYLEAIATYTTLGGDVFMQIGAEERAGARDAEVIAAMLDDPPLPPEWLAKLADGAALYPQAGLLRPVAAIEAFTRTATLMLDAPVGGFDRVADGWHVLAPDGKARLKADAIVLGCGPSLAQFEPAQFLPLEFSRGQLEWGACDAPLARALEADGYCAPFGGGAIFGATFDKIAGADTVSANDESRTRNLATLTKLAPHVAAHLDASRLTSRAAIRVATRDRLPIAGLIPDAPAWLAQNAPLAHGAKHDASLPAPALDGVYVIGGLGSRGLTLAPLLGELIAASMFGEPQTLSQPALDAVHPARFLHRSLKKRVTKRAGTGEDAD